MGPQSRNLLFLVAFAATNLPRSAGQVLPAPAQVNVQFARDIEPIFRSRCVSCHGSKTQSGGFRLDGRNQALAGGYSGAVIQPGKSAESRLIQMVGGLPDRVAMPLTGPRLTAEQIGLLRAWIDQGAEWPDAGAGNAPAPQVSQDANVHWAFRPPLRPAIPQTHNAAWVRNPIDSMILSRLEASGIQPSSEADRVTLIRRLNLDLIGLPPAPEEVAEFVGDRRPDAYERVVDRLLSSPHYGEKWARYWLDQARYGDSDGFETDAPRPWAWRYRQWVIEALNRNMPFDQFTIEQLAGDLLPHASIEQHVATGFNRNTLTNREGGMDLEMLRIEQIMDRASTLGTVWLGLTVGCAQCHDHKYDPIRQKEYYQFFAFFNNAVEVNIEAPLKGELGPYLHNKPEHDRRRKELLEAYKAPELQPEWERKTLEAATNPKVGDNWVLAWETVGYDFDGGQDILRTPPDRRTQKQQDQLTDHFIKWYGLAFGGERYKEVKFKELEEKLQQLDEEYPALTEAPAIAQNPHPPATHLLIRGDFRQPGIEVRPGTPAILPPLAAGSKPTRLDLARWLVSPENPLTARVAVNRMWQEFFGRGLVETSENFGTRGDRPSHPELLDWLATEFVSNGWDVKRMHKLIVESATYRQSSRIRPELQDRDPFNKLLARQARLRLSAELIRDSALSVSGLLNPAIGGKSVFPPQPASVGDLAYRNHWKESKGADIFRRGLYVFRKRTMPYPQLAAFDAPDSLTPCTRRERSTTPLQSLTLLNDPVFFEAARGLATRILRDAPADLGQRIDYAFRLCLGRGPTQLEKDRVARYYSDQKQSIAGNPSSIDGFYPPNGVERIDRAEAAVWVSIGSVLLNMDEFITRT
jgi:mono/diheme cytochrome c family protein